MGIILYAYEDKVRTRGYYDFEVEFGMYTTENFFYDQHKIGLGIKIFADKEYYKIEEIPYFEPEPECCICM